MRFQSILSPILAAVLAVSTVSSVSAQEKDEDVAEWMLAIIGGQSLIFTPTKYTTSTECLLVANTIRDMSTTETFCIPAHFTDERIARYKAEMAEAVVKAEEVKKAVEFLENVKREDIEKYRRERPALEAERREILNDRNKLNQKQYADRVLEIDAILRIIK